MFVAALAALAPAAIFAQPPPGSGPGTFGSGVTYTTRYHEGYSEATVRNTDEASFLESESSILSAVVAYYNAFTPEQLPQNAQNLISSVLTVSLSSGDATAVSSAVCGNNIVETGEQCDDGDTASGDGCSSVCTIESVACTCNDGVPATGADCIVSGSNTCASCDAGFGTPNSDGNCVNVNVNCVCDGGVAATDGTCTVDGANVCASCSAGYRKESNACTPIDSCLTGAPTVFSVVAGQVTIATSGSPTTAECGNLKSSLDTVLNNGFEATWSSVTFRSVFGDKDVATCTDSGTSNADERGCACHALLSSFGCSTADIETECDTDGSTTSVSSCCSGTTISATAGSADALMACTEFSGNQCVCANGVAVEDSECATDGANTCSGCNTGFSKDSNDDCVATSTAKAKTLDATCWGFGDETFTAAQNAVASPSSPLTQTDCNEYATSVFTTLSSVTASVTCENLANDNNDERGCLCHSILDSLGCSAAQTGASTACNRDTGGSAVDTCCADVNGDGTANSFSSLANCSPFGGTTCTCVDGVPATGTACPVSGNTCASCDAGFGTPNSDGDCVSATACTCTDGTAATGAACVTAGSNTCASCDAGFGTPNSDGDCVATVVTCVCNNGVAATGSACVTAGSNTCASCNAGSTLGGDGNDCVNSESVVGRLTVYIPLFTEGIDDATGETMVQLINDAWASAQMTTTNTVNGFQGIGLTVDSITCKLGCYVDSATALTGALSLVAAMLLLLGINLL